MQRMTAMHESRATICAASVTCAPIGNELKDVRKTEIRYERSAQDGGFEVSCDCGHTFDVPSGSREAQCPHCSTTQAMGTLFDTWWQAEPTVGRYAYREA